MCFYKTHGRSVMSILPGNQSCGLQTPVLMPVLGRDSSSQECTASSGNGKEQRIEQLSKRRLKCIVRRWHKRNSILD